MSTVTVRRITDPDDPAVAQFGDLQERTYAEPDQLIPPSAMPYMLRRQSGARRNLMVVAEQDGRVVGGALFHYFPPVGTGFSSYMAVDPTVRRQGVARKIHDARFACLEQEAGGKVHGLFIDVVNPDRLSDEERERERLISIDPMERRQAFARLGFRRVDIGYYQPPSGGEPEPLTTLDLLYCPRTPADSVATDLVAGTMYAYWAPWLGEQAARYHSQRLRHMADGAEIPLRMP